MNISSPTEGSERSKEHCRKYLNYFRKYINHHKATIGGNMNIKGATGIEDSEANEKHVIGKQKRGTVFHLAENA